MPQLTLEVVIVVLSYNTCKNLLELIVQLLSVSLVIPKVSHLSYAQSLTLVTLVSVHLDGFFCFDNSLLNLKAMFLDFRLLYPVL